MKMKNIILFLPCVWILCFSAPCQAEVYNLRNRANYQEQIRYQNPIASIPIEKAQRDLSEKLSQVYPNHFQKRKELFVKCMNDYIYLSKPSDAASVNILSGLTRIYYPHFTTIRLLYEQKIRGAGSPRY